MQVGDHDPADVTEQRLRLLAERIRCLSAIQEAAEHRSAVFDLICAQADRRAAVDALCSLFGWDRLQAKLGLDTPLVAFTEERRARLRTDLDAAVREFKMLDVVR